MTRWLTYNEYAERAGVRWSLLKVLLRGSPARYQWEIVNQGSGDTASRAVYRTVHTAVLEPEHLADSYAVYDGRRYGSAFDARVLANPGKAILKTKELEQISATASAVHAHDIAGPLVLGIDGWSEISRFWEDPATGLACKARFDRVVDKKDHVEIWDLKNVGDASEDGVRRMVKRMSWDGQGAHYLAGCRTLSPKTTFTYGLICVESDAPHEIGVWRMSERDLSEAEERRQELLQIVKACTDSGDWPALCTEVKELDLNPWKTQAKFEVVND